jgi:hypothetical protein
MAPIATHFIRIPGVERVLEVHAESHDEAARLACEELGLHFLPDGAVVTQFLSEASACSSAT